MTIHVHRLGGCGPAPLAHYLKALGILRLVAEQADPAARGFWQDERFALATRLDRNELLRFFLDEYKPTPMVAPWNGGSGHYPNDNMEAIGPLSVTDAVRFAGIREALRASKALVNGREKSPKDEAKEVMIGACRATWSGGQLAWLNAAVVLAGSEVKYPALLGTGGNDGRLEFTNNFMQRLVDLFDVATGNASLAARGLLASALFATATDGLVDRAIGQFSPGGAGGANSTRGYSGSSLINPWDYVLMLEGAPIFSVAAVRRLEGAGVAQAAAPFALRAQAAGYASATEDDESTRGEQWLPMWRSPSLLIEIQAIMREGRMRAGRSSARNAVDAARAFARLGTARGVDCFVRFGYIERNGQSNLAVPLGTWSVKLRPDVRLIDDIDPWLDALRRAAGHDHAPAALGRIVRQIEGDVLTVCRDPGVRGHWQSLLASLGQAEDELVRRPRLAVELGVQPLPPLSAGWCRAADDGSPEFWIALAIASQRPPLTKKLVGGIRSHCIPLDVGSKWPRFAANSNGLAVGPDQVWTARDLTDDLASVVLRRSIRSSSHGVPGLALEPVVTAPLACVAQFLDGRLDEVRISRLVRGLMALETDEPLEHDQATRPRPDSYEHADAAHALFRLLWLPASYSAREANNLIAPTDDPTALRLLLSGRIDAASRVAVRRLVARGLRPKLSHLTGSAVLGRRVVAALAIPISLADARLLRTTICAPERGRAVRDGANTREPTWRTP